MDTKPVIRALVGVYVEPWGLIGPGTLVTLEEAVEYQALGFWVLLDPTDEIALAAWERIQRVTPSRWRRV